MKPRQTIAAVTAAGGAIGGAIVRHLLEQGFAVAAIDVDAQAIERLRVNTESDRLFPLIGDMTAPEDVERVFGEVERLGSLRVLVNGVGSRCSGGLRDLSLTDWQRKFDLNLSSVFLCTRAVLPMLERGDGDRVIVNISSTLATVADPETLAYSTFKAGLEQLTRALALELAPAGIRAVAVAPGPVSATGGEADYDTPDFAHLNPLGRFATVEEIAGVVGFLASPAATYITGIVLRVDGGDSALGAGWGPLLALQRGSSAQA
jgi:NAD(P)-dependent dehydrogenase (short-subunit alcohol dehydrogenase family)